MSTVPLGAMRPVHVVGIGLHPYQFPGDTPYVTLGTTAVRGALADAGLSWPDIQSAYVGSGTIGMAAGRVLTKHLGASGLSVATIENASASGSTAFRSACIEVASGLVDVAIAIGVDKAGPTIQRAFTREEIPRFSDMAELPVVKFALAAEEYMAQTGATAAQIAAVAVKNHHNASLNPYAQFRKPRSLEEVLGAKKVAGIITAPQCCPRGDGGAAAIVMSEEALARFGIAPHRAVRVLSSVATSDRQLDDEIASAVEITRRMTAQALEHAAVAPEDLDIVELHEAFSIEEPLYIEAMGICGEGEGAHFIATGEADIGGRCAVNASGGLLGMGHPLGPTGVGQIAEIVRQLRGEAGDRQHPEARTALAHMIGLGQVGFAHILQMDRHDGR